MSQCKWVTLNHCPGWLYRGLRHFNSQGHIMAVGDAHAFPGFLTPVLTQLSFQSHQLLFSHTSAEVGGENTPEGIFTSTGLELITTRS